MLLSLYTLVRNAVHLACPIVCDPLNANKRNKDPRSMVRTHVTHRFEVSVVPDKATRSLDDRPFLEKAEIRVARSEVGAGRSLLASFKLAEVESLLPSCTVHEGPPN